VGQSFYPSFKKRWMEFRFFAKQANGIGWGKAQCFSQVFGGRL
jgi:hypothetical protein